MLLELEAPDPATAPALSEAIEYFDQARRRFLEGESRLAVESLRQSLATLVGKQATEEDDADAVATNLKASRSAVRMGAVDYERRYELTRQALKFLVDLGAHPETAETSPAEARSCLTMVAGLLQWYAAQ